MCLSGTVSGQLMSLVSKAVIIAYRATKAFPDLEVSTCHTYDIHFPYRWRCTTPR